MNCQAVQNQILALPDPREISPALRSHVAGCAACQAWARQAARLEELLEQLPVPAAPEQKKEILLGDLMQAEPVIRPLPAPATRPGLGIVAVQFLRRNAAYVGGLAAAVLVAVGVYWFWPPPTPGPGETVKTQKHPLLEKMVARDVELARAKSPAERLDILNGMADDIATEARGMARIAPGAELRQMAGWYEKAVKEGVVTQAGRVELPAVEKAKLLDSLAAKFDADAAATEALAREVPPDAQPALKRMADAAREGKEALRAAARGGK